MQIMRVATFDSTPSPIELTGAWTHFRTPNPLYLQQQRQREGTHVFVAPRYGDVGVVVLRAHDGLDAVGDEVVGLEAVAHSVGAHGLQTCEPFVSWLESMYYQCKKTNWFWGKQAAASLITYVVIKLAAPR